MFSCVCVFVVGVIPETLRKKIYIFFLQKSIIVLMHIIRYSVVIISVIIVAWVLYPIIGFISGGVSEAGRSRIVFCMIKARMPGDTTLDGICDAKCVEECANISSNPREYKIYKQLYSKDLCSVIDFAPGCQWIEPQAWVGLKMYRERNPAAREHRNEYYNFIGVIATCAYSRKKCGEKDVGGEGMY